MNEAFSSNQSFDIEIASPYDLSFPTDLLSSEWDNRIREADEAVSNIMDNVIGLSPIATQLYESRKVNKSHYVVQMTEEVAKGIKDGSIKLSQNKKGELFAQLMNGNLFGEKLPIKEEILTVGLDPVMMASALQMKAMQDQLKEISKQISTIDVNVKSVLIGQQNDRIAQYYSGAALYLQARQISDQMLKKVMISQAMKTLSDASFQIKLNMDEDIKYLVQKEYKNEKGKRAIEIDKRMKSINQGFLFIHQASLLKAAIYCEQGELAAMAVALDEYSKFIRDTIAKNANLLSQCDVADNGSDSGVWKSRAQFKLDTETLRKQISTKEKILYICDRGVA